MIFGFPLYLAVAHVLVLRLMLKSNLQVYVVSVYFTCLPYSSATILESLSDIRIGVIAPEITDI